MMNTEYINKLTNEYIDKHCKEQVLEDYAIEFSKEYALEVFNSVKDKPQIAKQLKRKPDLYIPILSVQKNLDFTFDKSKTTIEIEVDQTSV